MMSFIAQVILIYIYWNLTDREKNKFKKLEVQDVSASVLDETTEGLVDKSMSASSLSANIVAENFTSSSSQKNNKDVNNSTSLHASIVNSNSSMSPSQTKKSPSSANFKGPSSPTQI